jgi:site-specific recombinase XerD
LEYFLRNYEAYLRQQQKEEKTIRMYLHETGYFLLYLKKQQKSLWQLEKSDLLQYRDELLRKEMKVSTINKSISTLSSFFRWACQNGYIRENFASQLRFHQEQSFSANWLSKEQEQLLLKAAAKERNPFKKARNEALLAVMLYAGLRIEEVSKLHTYSIKNDYLLIVNQVNISREIPLCSKAKEKIQAWMKVRKRLKKKMYLESTYLFVTERSGQMQPRAIQYVVKAYSKRLGFLITCQMLRNTFCRRLVENGKTPEEVQMLAGHKSISISYKYFNFRGETSEEINWSSVICIFGILVSSM